MTPAAGSTPTSGSWWKARTSVKPLSFSILSCVLSGETSKFLWAPQDPNYRTRLLKCFANLDSRVVRRLSPIYSPGVWPQLTRLRFYRLHPSSCSLSTGANKEVRNAKPNSAICNFMDLAHRSVQGWAKVALVFSGRSVLPSLLSRPESRPLPHYRHYST